MCGLSNVVSTGIKTLSALADPVRLCLSSVVSTRTHAHRTRCQRTRTKSSVLSKLQQFDWNFDHIFHPLSVANVNRHLMKVSYSLMRRSVFTRTFLNSWAIWCANFLGSARTFFGLAFTAAALGRMYITYCQQSPRAAASWWLEDRAHRRR